MSKSKARFLAELLSSDGRVIKTKSQASTIVLGDLPTIPNSKLQNSSVTIAGEGVSLGASLTLNTGDVTEHTAYKYYTDARARASISATGSLSYNSTTGVMSFTMPAQNTSNITEGSNLYFTNARADARIVNAGSANWNTAYGWGNHASAGYVTSSGNTVIGTDTDLSFAGANVLASIALTDGVITAYTNRVLTLANLGYTGETNATADQTNAEIRAAVEAATDSNVFTNADHSKLDGIATGATNTAAPHYTSAIAVGAGGLTQQNFTTTLKNKLDGIAASANNYVLPFTNNSSNWNTAYGWGNHASAGYTNDQTPAEILAALKTVDVNGTAGVNAGTVDGIASSRIIYGANASGTGEGTFSDWNAVTKSGFYSHSGASNKWSTVNWSSILHTKLYNSNNSYATQLGFDTYNNNLYTRTNNNGTWTSWDKIWHAGVDGAGSGLDADLLDGQQGSYYRAYANLTGTPTIPSLSGYATESYVGTQISNLVDSSPAALNTLNELAAAIGDDANFSTTVTNNIATKLPLAGGTLTGGLGGTTASFSGNLTALNHIVTAGDGNKIGFWGGTGSYAIWMASSGSGGRQAYEPNSDYNMYFRMGGGTNRGFVFQTGSSSKVGIDSLGNIRADGVISSNNRQAMNCAHWSNGGTSTGAVKITLPGSVGSVHSMPVIEVTTYQYSANAHVIYTISGHNWSSASNWYNTKVTSIGGPPLSVRLGHDGTNYCIIIGDTSTSWSYGSVAVALKVHPSYYAASQNFTTGWGTSQITSMPSTVTAVGVGRVWDSTNDASGSGLDADLLDGQQGSYYYSPGNPGPASETVSSTNTVTITGTKYFKPAGTVTSPLSGGGNASLQAYSVGGNYAAYMAFHRSGHYAINWGLDTSNNMVLGGWSAHASIPSFKVVTSTRMAETGGQGILWGAGNDGSGSGLDADLLDGQQGSYYLTASNFTGTLHRDRLPNFVHLGTSTTTGYATDDGNWGSRLNVSSTVHAKIEVSQEANSMRSAWYAHTGQTGIKFGTLTSHVVDFITAGSVRMSIPSNSGLVTTTGQGTLWGSSNDGSGSGLDADLLDGMNQSSSVVANTIVARQANGYIYANHINFSTSETENPTINSFFVSNGDGWSRKASKAHVASQMGSHLVRTDGSNAAFVKVPANYTGNLNSITNAGVYFTEGTGSISNNPFSSSGSFLQFGDAGGTDVRLQFYAKSSLDRIAFRNQWGNGNWGTWKEFWTDANDGSGSGLDADLLDGQQGSYYYAASNPSGYQTGTGTVAQSHYVSGNAFATNGPDSVLEYAQSSSVSDTKLAPSTDWHNSIRMGHGDPYSYYSSAIAIRMTGSGPGDLYTQTIQSGTGGGWSKHWSARNDGAGSGLDADLLDGQHGSHYLAWANVTGKPTIPTNNNQLTNGASYTTIDTRAYNSTNSYIGGYYQNGGTGQKPNHSKMGAGKLTFSMQNASNLGFGGPWNDVLWMSSYTGGDVKRSVAIVSSKYDNTSLWVAKQNYDSTSWGTGYLLWNAGNDGAGSGLDADLLDGQHGSYYYSPANPSPDTNTTYNFGGSTFTSRNSGNAIAIDSVTTNMVGYVNGSTAAGYADGAGFSAAYSSSWVGQLFVDFRTGKLSTRGKNSGTWQAHRFMWDNLNDGSGSGLDADLLDGQQPSDSGGASKIAQYATNGYLYTNNWIHPANGSGLFYNAGVHFYESGNKMYSSTAFHSATQGLLWGATNDGSGSGLDADLLDGVHGASFLRTDTGDTIDNNVIITQRGEFTTGTSGQNNSRQAGTLSYSYGYQFGGAWTSPYPDLVLGYHTGVRIGGYYGYGGTRFYNDHPSRSSTIIFSVANGDAHVRATNNIYAYTSDKRLKENFRPIENAVDKVKAIGGFIFDWRKDMMEKHDFTPDQQQDDAGLIAQEVQKVMPAAIKRAPFDHDLTKPNQSKSGEEFLTVQYEKMVPLLVEAIKEQQKQIDKQQKQINELNEKLENK